MPTCLARASWENRSSAGAWELACSRECGCQEGLFLISHGIRPLHEPQSTPVLFFQHIPHIDPSRLKAEGQLGVAGALRRGCNSWLGGPRLEQGLLLWMGLNAISQGSREKGVSGWW